MSPKKALKPTSLLDFLKIPYTVVSDGSEILMDCVYCGKDNHLYVRADGVEAGLHYCQKCDTSGNWNTLKDEILNHVVRTSVGKGNEYWRLRGFSDSLIDVAQLGFYEPLDRYTIPYYEKGKVVNIAFRSKGGADTGDKYLRLPGITATNYIWTNDGEDTYVVEGEVNALTLSMFRKGLFIGLPGGNTVKESLIPLVGQSKVTGVFDDDATGHNGAKKLKALFPNVRILFMKEDFNSLLVTGKESEINRLLEETKAQVIEEGPKSMPVTTYLKMPDLVGDWLVEDLWVDQALGFVAGIPKAMKSLFTLHLAYHVATGTPFLRKKILHPGTVLLVQEEDNDHIIKQRLGAISGAESADHLRIWTPGVTGSHIRLDLESGIEALDAEVGRLGPVLIILDPLANMHTLENENDAATMNKMLEHLRHLRDYRRCSIMVVHHLRKEGPGESGGNYGQRMRGSSVLHAKSESALYLDRLGQSDLVRVRIETKLYPSRTLEVRFRNGRFELEQEFGAGVDGEEE